LIPGMLPTQCQIITTGFVCKSRTTHYSSFVPFLPFRMNEYTLRHYRQT
jgi:hypothetical protein